MKKTDDKNSGLNVPIESILVLVSQLHDQFQAFQKDLNVLNSRVKRLDEALSRISFVRTKWVTLTYSHHDRELFFNKSYPIKFDKNEAQLLGIMFIKKSGKPKGKVFYCQEVADNFKRLNSGSATAKAVHQTIKRIDEKVKNLTHLEVFSITTKEFHIH